MATARSHVFINRPADEVWKAITDPAGITSWFPGITGCTMNGNVRTVTTSRGTTVDEEVVTNDQSLRRFQYRIVPGLVPVESHLGTIDVIEHGPESIVVYSTDVTPDTFGSTMQTTIDAATKALKEHLETP
ncbi:MAG TPA: SRPBCC family protein [Acidimicrobiales bacterium]|nr:SRPBCC family protein [Acidimicrobiales bacterium]